MLEGEKLSLKVSIETLEMEKENLLATVNTQEAKLAHLLSHEKILEERIVQSESFVIHASHCNSELQGKLSDLNQKNIALTKGYDLLKHNSSKMEEILSCKNEIEKLKLEKDEETAFYEENTRLMTSKAVEKFNLMLKEVVTSLSSNNIYY
jgi:hypothetical protein